MPFPKGKIYPVEGWEHIEVVVPMQPEESVEEWCCRCLAYFKLANYDLFKIKISQPEVNGEQLPNPTIAITIKNETLDHSACLKLHPYDIKRVIYSEKVF